MYTHFQTELATVKTTAGVVLENATIVSVLATVQTEGNIPIPEQYLGCDILGKLWIAETQEFQDCEIVTEEQLTQEERITELEAAMYILAGMEV